MGFALGAAEYLTKPIDHDRLFAMLEKLCPGDREHQVLIIEDDAATREMMRRVVDRAHWKSREAANGLEGLERLKEGVPDVIVLDLMMPQMDGFQFLGRLREEPEWASIPVVVVTAKSLSATDRQFLDGRVKRLVQKGEEDLNNLLSVLNGALPIDRD
jgi:CheY-like chemotaxis protein